MESKEKKLSTTTNLGHTPNAPTDSYPTTPISRRTPHERTVSPKSRKLQVPCDSFQVALIYPTHYPSGPTTNDCLLRRNTHSVFAVRYGERATTSHPEQQVPATHWHPHERDHRRPAIDDLHRRSSEDGENPCGRSCEPSTSSYRREGYPLGIISTIDRQPRRGWRKWRLASGSIGAHQWSLYSSPRWQEYVAGDTLIREQNLKVGVCCP